MLILQTQKDKYSIMKNKNDRLEAIKSLLSSKEMGTQEELLQALREEGFILTQATLSRDLKRLKVAKASTINGQYVYVLPNETMYRRVHTPLKTSELPKDIGLQGITFTGNLLVIHTRPGYASSVAYNIDNSNIPGICGTIAGDDTIFIAIAENSDHEALLQGLRDNMIL